MSENEMEPGNELTHSLSARRKEKKWGKSGKERKRGTIERGQIARPKEKSN